MSGCEEPWFGGNLHFFLMRLERVRVLCQSVSGVDVPWRSRLVSQKSVTEVPGFEDLKIASEYISFLRLVC